jgi:hypothetical protein
MKAYILFFWIIYLVTVDAVFSYAQSNNPCGATFQIQANTNTLKIGESIELNCRIKNLSTNIAFEVAADPLVDAPVLLTDSAGKTYIPPDLHSPSWDQAFYFPSEYVLGPSNSCRWTLAFSIDKSFTPGSYEVKARRTIFFASTNVFGGNCKLDSNALGIKIQ